MARGTASMGCWRSPARSPGPAPSLVGLGVRDALHGGPVPGGVTWGGDSRSATSVRVVYRIFRVGSTHTSPSLLSRRRACARH